MDALKGTALVALAAAGWGTWALFLRGSGLPPSWQSVMILLVIAVASAPFALRAAMGRGRPHSQPRPALLWALLGLLGLLDAGNYVLYFGALDRGPIAVAVLTHYLAPVVVAALAPALLREPLGRRTPPALLCSLGGLALLVAGSGGLSGEALPTALLGGASALFYGGNTLLSKKLLRDFSGSELLSWHCFVAAGALALIAREPLPALPLFLWRPVLGALLVGCLGASIFYVGLRHITAQRAAVLTYLEPLVAAAVGALAFGEALTRVSLLGAALILAGGLVVIVSPTRS